MIDALREVIEEVEHLDPAAQDIIAALIRQKLKELEEEEREWDALVSTPGSQRFLDMLAEEARKENAAGLTRDLDELL